MGTEGLQHLEQSQQEEDDLRESRAEAMPHGPISYESVRNMKGFCTAEHLFMKIIYFC